MGLVDMVYTVGGMSIDTETMLPIQPLIDWWENAYPRHSPTNCQCVVGGTCASHESLAKALGVSRATLHRRISSKELTMKEADEWAILLGVHVLGIWPNWDKAPVQAALSTKKPKWTGRVI